MEKNNNSCQKKRSFAASGIQDDFVELLDWHILIHYLLGRLEKLKTAISINLLCCSRDKFFFFYMLSNRL